MTRYWCDPEGTICPNPPIYEVIGRINNDRAIGRTYACGKHIAPVLRTHMTEQGLMVRSLRQ